MEQHVSIGNVKRDISELINRVAFGGERIILTSRGKPKAALVSMEDYQQLHPPQPEEQARMLNWMQQTKTLANEIYASRARKMIDVDEILNASRAELEERNEWITRSN